MTKNYFSIERNGKCLDKMVLMFEGNVDFEDLMDMSYEHMKSYEDLDRFIIAVSDATNECGGNELIINLVDSDDVFVWGIVIYIDGHHGDQNIL